MATASAVSKPSQPFEQVYVFELSRLMLMLE